MGCFPKRWCWSADANKILGDPRWAHGPAKREGIREQGRAPRDEISAHGRARRLYSRRAGLSLVHDR
jgi:hypothetical protein